MSAASSLESTSWINEDTTPDRVRAQRSPDTGTGRSKYDAVVSAVVTLPTAGCWVMPKSIVAPSRSVKVSTAPLRVTEKPAVENSSSKYFATPSALFAPTVALTPALKLRTTGKPEAGSTVSDQTSPS